MRTTLLSLALLSCAACCLAQPAQHRGIWMHATSARTPEQADQVLDRIQQAHLNAIYCLVFYWGGHAYYSSEIVARAEDIAPDFDPLQYLVAGAHRRGMELHAWFVNGENGSPEPGTVFAQHPDWRIEARNGQAVDWYDFGKPEVRQFQRDLMLEVLQKYDVDGIHFDYIRYPGTGYCYCADCRAEFERQHGPLLMEVLGETFPLVGRFGANPLAEPTTAQVLAQFDHGVPAITLNTLGDGQCLLLNWHAEESRVTAVDTVLKRALARFGAQDGNVYAYNTPSNRERYGDRFLALGMQWLAALGYKPQRLSPEKGIGGLKPTDVLVLTCVYAMDADEAASLEAFVRAGGHVVFVDGPVFGIRHEALQRATGLARSGGYFSDQHVIAAVGESELVQRRQGQVDVAKYQDTLAKWAQFQRDNVTALVRDVYGEAKQIKPEAQVTAAVFYNRRAADGVHQDWYAWLREGIIDYVIPMAYTMNDADLSAALAEWQQADPRLERIIPGLSIYMRTDGGSVSRPADVVLRQTDLCVQAGAVGTCYFAVNYLSDELTKAMAEGPFREAATPYRPPP